MPTEYEIKLTIAYSYDHPAGASRSVLRMLPRSDAHQQLIAGAVDCDPAPSSRKDSMDFFGNYVSEVAHETALSDLAFRFEGRVRRSDAAPALDLSAGMADLRDEISAYKSLSAQAPHHFLGASERVWPDADIAAFAQKHVSPRQSVREALISMSDAVHDLMTFDSEATEVSTTPVDAFKAKRGVCQDFSHITIAALRSVGIPAGYVSGFLRTKPPEGQARLEGADAMHAWVRAWCGGEAGWIEIDPTNAMLVGGDHIVVAVGRDYADVAPVKGSLRAAGDHVTRHEVDVIPL